MPDGYCQKQLSFELNSSISCSFLMHVVIMIIILFIKVINNDMVINVDCFLMMYVDY